MINKLTHEFFSDDMGHDAGGLTQGKGLLISWQRGPRGRNDRTGELNPPNGAFVEDVIQAAIDRLTHFQNSKFACSENQEAIGFLTEALAGLARRAAKRTARGVMGTHQV